VKIGLFGINAGVCSDAETLKRAAIACERAGFDSLWTAEHVVLPDPHVPPSPLPPEYPLLDPAVALAFAAAHTTRILLATGVIILPQRNPLVLAKELASVDVLSKGRLMFGVGVGYLEPEFRALGISFENKGARTNEFIEAIRTMWTQEKPAYAGRHVEFGKIQAMPRPVRKPHPPIVLGGSAPQSLRRALKYGNGWYAFNSRPDEVEGHLARLKEVGKRVERPAELGRLEITVTPPPGQPVDSALVARYADLGVDRLVPYPIVNTPEALLAWIVGPGAELVGNS